MDIDLGTIYSNIALRTDNAFKALDNLADRFNKFGEKGRQRIAEVNKAFENIAGIAKYQSALDKATVAYDQQKKKVAELTKEIQAYRAALPKGESTEALISEKFGPALAEAKTQMSEYADEVRKAEGALDAYVVSQQEAAVATAEQKAAAMEATQTQKDTTLASYALSMGLRNLSGISGGLVGNLSDVASQVVYLRQVMKASQTGASAFATAVTGIIGGVTIAATVIMKLVEAHNAEVEAQKEAAIAAREARREAAEYIQTAQQETRAAEVALNTLKNAASSTEETTAAKNELARLFPSLVTGWTNEGNAILGNNSAIEAQIGLQKEQIKLKREISALGMEAAIKALEDAKKEAEGWQGFFEGLGIDDASGARIKNNKDRQKELQLEAELRDSITSTIQMQIEGYSDLTAAQKLAADAHIAEALAVGDLTDIAKGGFRDIAAAAIKAASDEKKLADARAALAGNTKKAVEAQYSLNDSIDDTTTGLNSLSSAYNALSKGENLSMDNLLKLIGLYPEIAKYIAETGDLTLQKGEYLKTVANISTEAAKKEIESQIWVLEAQRDTAQALMDNLVKAWNSVTNAASKAALAQQIALAGDDLAGYDEQINNLKAKLEGIGSFSFSGDGSGSGGSKSKSAYEQAMEDFEYQKKINDWTERETLEHLENINAMYSKSADEQRDIDLKLKDQRKRAREEELAIEEAHLEYLTAIGKDTAAMWEEYYKKVAESAKEGSAEQWKYATEAVEREKQAVQELIDNTNDEYSHKKAMGEEYLYDYIAALQELLKNEKLTAEQREKIEEDLYSARSDYKDKLMADDEHRLWEMHLGEEELLKARIEMLDHWLRHYSLTEEQIREILKERYDLEMKLIDIEKKKMEQQFKSAQDETIKMLNAQKQAWKDWVTSVKNTISEYLKALDDMTKEEDRAEKLAEKNRQIEETQLRLAYENDLTNMRNLSKELSKLEKEKNKMLSSWALEDTKDALKDLAEQVGELSDSQQKALETEIARVKEMTEAEYQRNLQMYESGLINNPITQFSQESANALMKQFQMSVDASLTSLADTYKDVGVTLKQSIEEGFKSALQSVASTFEYFKELQGKLTGQAASIATQAAMDYEARQQTTNNITYSPTINFYEPIKSPYEVARAVDEVGRKLLEGYYN